MLPDPTKPGSFSSTRMVPPGSLNYYYTYDGQKKLASDQRTLQIAKTHIIDNIV
jgi:hypothetical protein